MSDIRNAAIREIDAAKVIKANIASLTDDSDTIRDTLEGETNLDGIIRALLISIEDDKGLRDSANATARTIANRAGRFEARIDAKRELIRLAMELAEWTSKEFDVATVTMKKAAPALQVTKEEDIPAEFWKPGKPSIDRTALLKALKAERTIEGAQLKNGAPVLDIRSA